MRRIAIVSEHASPVAPAGSVDSGGQNIYVGQVARQLAMRGHLVDIFTRRDSLCLPAEMPWQQGVRIIHVDAGPPHELPKEELLPFMEDFRRCMELRFASPDEPYDLIHANFFMSAMAALPVARRAGIPLIVTFHALGRVRRLHQAEADRFPDSRFNIEEEIVRCADRIIAECPQDRSDLVGLYGADPDRIRMVACGYDPEEMWCMDQGELRRAMGWDPHAFYLLQLGRMVPRKGVDNVIRALAHLRQDHGVDARLCVVGGSSIDPSRESSPELARLAHVARQQGVEAAVAFVGRRGRHELRHFYGACDVFVTTPWYEPFGITPVEAMACGRPVVGSDTGGIRYTVVDGETGFLVPPKDPKALAVRLAVLANNAGLAQRMGMAGMRRASRLFTWNRVGMDLERVFDEAVAGTYGAPASMPTWPARSQLSA
jgi:glycosyltransferase involved in cell wall biosynthesis